MIRPLNILVVSDGKQGHLNPCLGVAKRLVAGPRGAVSSIFEPKLNRAQTLALRLKLRLRRPEFWSPGAAPGAAALLRRHVGIPSAVFAHPPDVVLTSGTMAGTVGVWLARATGARAVSLSCPNLIPAAYFDLLCIPHHDVRGTPGPNVVSLLLTPANFTRDEAQKAALELGAARSLTARYRYVAFLVGGSTKRFRLPVERLLGVGDLLLEHTHASGEKLLVTTSRRTPPALERALKQQLEGHPDVAYAVWAHETPENPVPAFLGLADKVVVTEDSYSMVSEAACIGTQAFVLKLGLRRKFARSYSRLATAGYVQWDTEAGLRPYLNALSGGRAYDAAGIAAAAILERLDRPA